MKKHLLYVTIGLGIALLLSVNRCSQVREENKRLSSNQRALLTDITYYKTQDSLNAASIEKLTLTVGEIKRHYPDLKREVENLGIKLKRVEQLAQTATESTYPVETTIRDSIFIRDTVPVTLRCIDFDNRYLSLSGCEENGLFKGNIRTVDTLVQVVHRVPRKFLFFRWGVKAIRQEIVSKNPYSKITYSEYLELKK